MPNSPSIAMGIIVVGVLAWIWFKRQLPPVLRRVFPLILIVIGGSNYLVGEFIFNKGPDDEGALFHAETALIKERRTAHWRIIKFLDYKNGPGTSGSGTYRYSYKISDETGTILCHYDKTTHKFDHDEIDKNQ